ncbi:hypothetical protein [Chryseobacterium sp. KMC2]|uniref:hypothetical protein n=1 Tax=Chryseobacterium sp. KMC2 TaxID=2800705 RepID=UPI0019218419|nr:hypothetical protein [Chryseobacterium sp. KMC2]MBL3550534.1 hypothetical protein [Chryseobacterium sp. KMC2]
MKSNIYITLLFLLSIISCNNKLGSQQLNQSEIASSKGEHIYISTINLGITGDKQFTLITNKKIVNVKDFDKTNSLEGLDPFIYSFSNDTLNLYFRNSVRYKVPFNTESIKINYFELNNADYIELYKKTFENKLYHAVPNHGISGGYPNMPKPPKEKSN